MEQINNMKCPITLEPIINGGMTCYGNIYEYDVIKKWFEENDIDPVTGEECPSKFIVKVDIHDPYINERVKDMRKTTELVFPITKSWTSVKILYEKYNGIKSEIKSIPKSEFDKYNECKRNLFSEENHAYINAIGSIEKTESDIFYDEHKIRDYDFIDLSKKMIHKKSFKSQKFIFTNLSDCKFINCDMSRCIFIGCDLSSVKFIGCEFIGEQTCFYKCTFSNTLFINCKIEYIDKWQTTSDLNEIIKILPKRLVNGNIIITKCCGFDCICVNE
ncbi:hypothetical protein [Saudi moumouvirus]|nr:hypothetical protein [Saudi moumouvirus]